MALIVSSKPPIVRKKNFTYGVTKDYPIDKIKEQLEHKEHIPQEAVYRTEEDKLFPVIRMIWEWYETTIEEKTDD